MECVELVGYSRSCFAEKELKRERIAGNVPGVLYGCGVLEHFFIPCFILRGIVYTNKKFIIDFSLNGEVHYCILKDIQFHPVSEMILHVDFLKIDNKKKVSSVVNITTEGTPIGVKNGGLLLQKKRKLTIFGFPKDIPSVVNINISNLNNGDTLRVRDLEKFQNCEYKDNLVDPIFTIKSPRGVSTEEASTK